MNFAVGDKAVHKIHGVGEICGVETLEYGGCPQDYYLMKILDNGIKIRFPKALSNGVIRTIISKDEIGNVYAILRQPGRTQSAVWNKRKKGLAEKIRTGGILEIAEVLRDLNKRKTGKGLSFGEKDIWEKAKSRIVLEISAAQGKTEIEVSAEIDEVLIS